MMMDHGDHARWWPMMMDHGDPLAASKKDLIHCIPLPGCTNVYPYGSQIHKGIRSSDHVFGGFWIDPLRVAREQGLDLPEAIHLSRTDPGGPFLALAPARLVVPRSLSLSHVGDGGVLPRIAPPGVVQEDGKVSDRLQGLPGSDY